MLRGENDPLRPVVIRAVHFGWMLLCAFIEVQATSAQPDGAVFSIPGAQVSVPADAGGDEGVTGAADLLRKFNFERDITPLFSRYGCNSSGCHGKAEGQNGFKLSVFGYDPAADFRSLLVESRGRRISVAAPEQSLLLMKMSGRMPHGGGVRIREGSPAYGKIRDWIAAGAPFGDANDPKIERIELTPAEQVLAFGGQQELRVRAIYSDGRKLDVTDLAQFQSNNETLAGVDENGLVRVRDVPGQAAVMARVMGAVAVSRILIPRPGGGADEEDYAGNNFIDEAVNRHLKKLGLRPSGLSEDAEFLRRVYVDLIGTLPTAQEAREFLTDAKPDRRSRLVDRLLERPEYADYWALKWADVLRVDRQTLGHKDAYAYYSWIRSSLAENKRFDVMARELIAAEGPIAEAPQGNFYKVFGKPGEVASAISQVFLGVRIACAECHHHPFDRWSQSDFFGMQAFFQPVSRRKSAMGEALMAEGKAEARHLRTGEMIAARVLGERGPAMAGEGRERSDARKQLADWMTSAGNPWFGRNLANRMAAHFFGRGLIEPVDDVRDTNPPSNPELLDAMAAFVAAEGFDVKQLIRAITSSRAYQRSSRPNETNERDEQNYSRALFKRISSEVLLDAVCQVTGRPEKFAGAPAGQRAIQLWDSDISHYFLKLFGRPVRKTACECERNSEASIGQVLHLLNSPEIHAKISHAGGAMARIARDVSGDSAVVEELYLAFYSRFPSARERQTVEGYLRERAGARPEAIEDLGWSMMNSIEFVFNH